MALSGRRLLPVGLKLNFAGIFRAIQEEGKLKLWNYPCPTAKTHGKNESFGAKGQLSPELRLREGYICGLHNFVGMCDTAANK